MAKVKVQKIINAPVSEVWKTWDDFGEISQFNPNVRASFLLHDSAETGKGAMRQCDFSDGKNHVRERIIGYEPGKRMVVDIYEGTVPLKRAVAEVSFQALGNSRTRVTMQMDFVPKMGLLGTMMIPMMKSQFRKAITELLRGNAAFVERGMMAHAA